MFEDQLKEIEELFEGADTSIIKSIIYFNGWSDYEECGGILIFVGIDDTIQFCSFGTCVFAEDNTDYFEPYEITQEVADQKIKDMEKMIDEIDF